ncbi:DUF2004 domain-containing protein [Flammeovirga sp. OC4]|uniref:DUF2004 domain-containing protein n=1 Tax=Flammeovirga sp. OC4 TaxID=1382345 RepID=UPI0005C61011|nr:DUF2004 domain-containing protein [Flammeovirga sp. OC4]
MKYKLPHFEEIDLIQLDEYYNVEIEHKGHKIGIDLNFEGKEIETQLFDEIKKIIENIESEDSKNRTYITSDFKDENGDTVKEYLEFHIEELAEELSGIVNFQDKSNSPEKQLLEKLKLGRIGFYPDGKYGSESFVVFDYIVDRELSDQIVVVNIDKEGKLINLAWES